MKCFRNSLSRVGNLKPDRRAITLRVLPVTALALSVCGASLAGWQAQASLPRWMQDAIGNSAIEAALYRAMEMPGLKALYPRPPKEAQGELSGLIGKAPEQAELYSLRAMEEERALDFAAAEKDWKTYAERTKDKLDARLELADYYHRRLAADDEVKTLMEVGAAPASPRERYTPDAEQRSWKAFERLLALAADQALDDETTCAGVCGVDRPLSEAAVAVCARVSLAGWMRSKDENRFDQAERADSSSIEGFSARCCLSAESLGIAGVPAWIVCIDRQGARDL